MLEHAVVGNGRIAALISPELAVEWLCLPRLDGPSVCGRLLDPQGGALTLEGEVVSSAYVRDSNVLESVVRVSGGEVVVHDACHPNAPAFVRRIGRHRGRPRVRLIVDLKPNYGRDHPGQELVEGRIRVGGVVDVVCSAAASQIANQQEVLIQEPLTLVILPSSDLVDGPPTEWIEASIADDRAFAASLPDDAVLRRSALAVRLHQMRDTGAIAAACTTSIPEAIGTPRCWDYRASWIRDGTFAAETLLSIGKQDEARAFFDFLLRATRDGVQPLYGLGGERELEESTLDHWQGFAGTGPVRIGNAAAEQVQHDAFGQLVWLAARLVEERVIGLEPALFDRVREWVRAAERARTQGDDGIWEFRDRSGPYTFSAVWREMAFRFGARLADQIEAPERDHWAQLAGAERTRILEAADQHGFFSQRLDAADPDASSLSFAGFGFVSARDRRFAATVSACERHLEIDGLMRRYLAEDDFGETTSTFGLCTLWWAEACILSGRLSRGEEILDRYSSCANRHGLFSEDVVPHTRERLGNFPQVYSHTWMIRLRKLLAAEPG